MKNLLEPLAKSLGAFKPFAATEEPLAKSLEPLAESRVAPPAGFDIDLDAMRQFVKIMQLKVSDLMMAQSMSKVKQLGAAAEAARMLLNGIEVAGDTDADVKVFRDKMKSVGTKLGAKEVELATLLGEVRAAVPGVENVASLGDEATILQKQAASAYGDALHVDNKCVEMTCAYVAFIFFSNPAVKSKNKTGLGLREKLQSTLATVDKINFAEDYKRLFVPQMVAMRELLKSKEEMPKAQEVAMASGLVTPSASGLVAPPATEAAPAAAVTTAAKSPPAAKPAAKPTAAKPDKPKAPPKTPPKAGRKEAAEKKRKSEEKTQDAKSDEQQAEAESDEAAKKASKVQESDVEMALWD